MAFMIKKSDQGAALVEYVMIMAFIGVLAIGAVHQTGTTVKDTFDDVALEIHDKNGAVDILDGGFGPTGGSADTGGSDPFYSIDPVYASACSNGTGEIEVEGFITPDANNDDEWTFSRHRKLSSPAVATFRFPSTGEQEYYGEFDGVDGFDRYNYTPTVIYPPKLESLHR